MQGRPPTVARTAEVVSNELPPIPPARDSPERAQLGPGFLSSLIGRPGTVVGSTSEAGRTNIPLVSGVGLMLRFRFPQSSLVQFVFAAITPILMLGSMLGRFSFRAWLPFVAPWTTIVYTVNAFLLWGAGWWAQQGAVDCSSGYVIRRSGPTAHAHRGL